MIKVPFGVCVRLSVVAEEVVAVEKTCLNPAKARAFNKCWVR